MKALFDVPINQRDEHWENQFLLQLPTARVKLLNEVPQSGPDGWPYMMVELSPEPTAEPIEKLLVWLSDKGIGLVVNPKKDVPDYVLTYGMIWNFIVRGGFVTRTNDSETSGAASVSEKIQIEEGTEVVGGEPTVEYLPDYVRNVLRLFFRDNEVPEMRCLLMSTDNIHYDLIFSLDALGNPPEPEHQSLLEALSWFLPNHYSLGLMREAGLPKFFKL